jgi:hypothetical protein
MIVHRKEKSPYFEQTIASLNGKSYFTVENPHRDLFPDSRVESYSLGTSEYVSFVDDDDLLYDISDLESHIEKTKPDAIYTNSTLFYNPEEKIPSRNMYKDDYTHVMKNCFDGRTYIHQLIVVKREIAQLAAQRARETQAKHNFPMMFDQAMMFEVALITDWEYFPKSCYGWRLWSSSAQEHSSSRCRPWDLLRVYKQKFESRFPEFKNL